MEAAVDQRRLSGGRLAVSWLPQSFDNPPVNDMYSKTQRNVMIGYIAFVVLTIFARHGGFDRQTSTPLDLILGAPIPFGFGVFAIQNGWISTRYSSPIDRDEAPVSFWFYVACALLLGAGMFLWGVRDAVQLIR